MAAATRFIGIFLDFRGWINTRSAAIKWHDQDSGGLPVRPGLWRFSLTGAAWRNNSGLPRFLAESRAFHSGAEEHMNGIIYLVGLIVVIMFILSFLGLR
jgi:hypothetical protein